MYLALRDSAITRRRAAQSAHVTGTHPSLALDQYVGVAADSLFGAATVKQESGHLTLQWGDLVGDLEHWQYDTFQVRWRRQSGEPDPVGFVLGADGKVAELRVDDGAMHFRRAR